MKTLCQFGFGLGGRIGGLAMFVVSLTFVTERLVGGPEMSEAFYEKDTVQEIRIRIEEADRREMVAALPDRIYVPATLEWRDTVMENVGIRFKGNSSSRPEQPHKRGYLIKINEFEKGARFLGLRRVSLDNGVQFGGLYSEILITEILRALEMPASRCNHARLFVNDAYQGIYVNVERIDEAFADHHLAGADGLLYKGEGGPGVNLDYPGPDLDVYKRGFEAKTKAAERNYRALERFLAIIGHGDPEGVGLAVLEETLTLDDFLQAMAVLLFSGAFDQATGWGPHNYYFYRPPQDGPWRYLTWDLDVGFADRAFGRVAVLGQWHAAWPMPGGGPPRPFLETILSRPELLNRYRRYADQILETHFRPERLRARIENLYQRIAPYLEKDPFPPGRATVPTDRSHRDVVESMSAFFEQRYRLARQQLDQPGPRPDYTRFELRQEAERRQRENPPRPGERSGRPTDLEIVERDGNVVRLRWRNHAPQAAMHVVQRANGLKGPFRNHVGDGVRGIRELVDPGAVPGQTYRYRVYAVFPTPQGPEGTPVSNEVISRP